MGSRPRCGGGAGEALQAEGAGEVVEYIFFLSGKTLSTLYSTRPRSGCLTDLQPLQQQQNSVNKANNTVAGKTNNSGKLGSPSSNDNTASPMDSASVTTPAVLTKEARGRVTRSSLGKAPLSLKSCEQVIWTLNIESYLFFFLFGLLLYNVMFFPAAKRVQHTGRSPRERSRSNKRLLAPNPAQNYQVGKYFRTNLRPQPTSSKTLKHRDRHCFPHELCCRVKEPGLCNPLQKLKQISLTPKKTIRAKRNKATNKRWDSDKWQDSEYSLHVCQIVKPTPHLRLAVGSGGVSEAPSPASKAGKLAQAASSSHKVTMTQYQILRFICSHGPQATILTVLGKLFPDKYLHSAYSRNNTQQSPTLPHQVTEYFPIRRSERKPKGELLKEQMEGIEARLLSTDDSTLDIKISMIENKGRGIVSKRAFSKGEFIVEYAGELISDEESKARWAVVEPWKQVLTFELQGVEIPAGHQQGELHVLVQAQGNRVLVCVQEWAN